MVVLGVVGGGSLGLLGVGGIVVVVVVVAGVGGGVAGVGVLRGGGVIGVGVNNGKFGFILIVLPVAPLVLADVCFYYDLQIASFTVTAEKTATSQRSICVIRCVNGCFLPCKERSS